MDTRKSLYENIVISGANTMFPGFSSRLEMEVKNLYRENIIKNSGREMKMNINVIDSPRRKYSVFIGACFLSKFYSEFDSYWISKSEWEEVGPQIIHKKCQNLII
jgi:actin-related protein